MENSKLITILEEVCDGSKTPFKAHNEILSLFSVGVRSEQFKNDGTYTYQYWTEKYFIKLSKDKYKAKGNNYGIVYYTERELRGKYARQYRK